MGAAGARVRAWTPGSWQLWTAGQLAGGQLAPAWVLVIFDGWRRGGRWRPAVAVRRCAAAVRLAAAGADWYGSY